MKNLLYSLGILILMYSCKSTGTSSPTATVNSFVAASREGNIDEIKKYISREDLSLLEMGERFISNVDSNAAKEMKNKFATEFKEKVKDAKINVKKETVDGTKAIVDVEFTMDGKTETRPFSLVKEDGKWKISLMSTGMNNSGAEKEDIEAAMKSIDLDSLQKAVQEEMGEMSKLDKDSLNKVMQEGLKELEKLKEERKSKQ